MAQHQDLKRKGGADPDHQMSRNHAPPPLSIEVPKMRDLPNKSNPWNDVQLPVDILLLTVKDCEFLACYTFLKNSFKSFHQTLGYVYFGTMGGSGEEALKVALMRCHEGCSAPGGSLVTVMNAVRELRPKATFLVGFCMGLNPQATKQGDVVLSSRLLTEEITAPVKRNIGNLNLFASEGWKPPLQNPVGEETEVPEVHRDSVILCGSQLFITKQRRMSQSHVIAVEREGEGLFAAAHDMNIEWVIVKGISHFSDDSNTPDKSWKSFASIMAASVVSNMLNDPVVFKKWPHYEDLTAKNQPQTTTKPDKQIPGADAVCLEECQKQLRSLYETCSKVKIIPWDQNSAVDIDEIYTDLSWVKDHRTPRGVTQKELNHYTEIFGSRGPRPAPKRILVYGQPGIGKTVFTKKATFDWSQQRYSETLGAFDLVLLVRLRDVSNLQDVPSILGASEVLDSKGAISVHNLYDYVCRHQEKVLLILDGYDEYVYCSKNESPVFKIWKKSQLRDSCVVITSREMKAEKLRNGSDAQFKIDGFNDERKEEFARIFLKDEDVEEFFEYLEDHDLSDLAQIPLLLLILCLLWTKTTREALPKKRAHIFAQFVKTLFDHLREKQSAESVVVKDYSDELYALGRLAFEALLQGQLYFPLSQLPAGYSLIERLIEVGLFQVLNMASLNPEKGVYFIHKSVQEYLAGNFLKEELTSKKAEGTNSLSKVDSVDKIFKTNEALKFAGELSEEAARDILIQLGMAAKKEELTEFKLDNETPSENDLSYNQRNFISLCNELFFYCSAETRKNLFPTFLSSLGGVLVINEEQLNVIVEEKLVQTTETPNYVFFNEYNDDRSYKDYTEQDYSNLIIITQQLNAVIVSSAGEKKGSEFLSNSTWRSIEQFFLKKEENNTHLYLAKIVKDEDKDIPSLPCDIIKALISKQETTKKTNMNGDESSEESSSSCCSKRHGLSRVRRIDVDDVNRSEMKLMSEMMPFITAPHEIWVWGEFFKVYDAEVTESLLRSIQLTHKLKGLILGAINVTSSPAVEFINNLFKKAPNLEELNMSHNPLLGAGVDSLIKHLSSAPHLETLWLYRVKMTPQQVMDLSSAIKQHGNITKLVSSYHDGDGNPKPEHEWPSEDFWKWFYPSLFSHSSNESQPQKQQIPTETPLSIHDSAFPADDQDTVRRTLSAPPDPTVEPMLTEASIPTAHGSSHGLVPQVQYSEYFSSPDIHTHHHSAPSTIFTPGESLSTDPHLISGPGPSTVTQDEPIDEELNLPSSSSKAYDEQVALQEESPGRLKQKAGKKRKVQEMITEGDEESPRKRKKRKKRKVHRMTEDVEGTSLNRRKRKKHKEHRRDKGGEESTRKGKTRKKHEEGRVTEQGKQILQGKQGQEQDKTIIHQGILTSNGIHLDLEVGDVFFPPFSVSTPTSIVVYRWKRRFRSPPLHEHEEVVSSVIEIATNSGQALKFKKSVQVFLCHSAPDLAGYETVVKKLVDTKNNVWEDVDVTKDLQYQSDIEDYPSLKEVEDLNLPVSHADISECSTYAVVCRLRSSPPFTITSFGGSFNHPHYPDVTVTIPENAVPSGTEFSVQLQVQELPSETERQGLRYGPVLRINCSQVVNFIKPVTIYLPVSLRGEPTGIPNTSLRVRVLFRNCDEDKEWTEITRDLRDPAQFDGKLVQFQVDHFSGFACAFENENNETDDVAKGLIERAESRVPLSAVFFAFFLPKSREVIVLVCCPTHLRKKVFRELKKCLQGMPNEGNSRKPLIPSQDKAFVFASGGVRPCKPEEREIYLEVDHDYQVRLELRVLVVSNNSLAKVEFWTASRPEDGIFLCELHLPIPAKDDSRQSVERGAQVTSKNRLANEENCVKGQKRLHMTKGNIKNGVVPYVVLEELSSKLGKSWEALARRLHFGNEEIEEITYNDQKHPKMQFSMLKKWKQKLGSEATYQVLFHALCDELVSRKDLAETFCVSNNHAAESGACFISSAQGPNLPSSSSHAFDESVSSQGTQGLVVNGSDHTQQRNEVGEGSVRTEKSTRKRKAQQTTADIEGTSQKRRKRKKHKEHRRDKETRNQSVVEGTLRKRRTHKEHKERRRDKETRNQSVVEGTSRKRRTHKEHKERRRDKETR